MSKEILREYITDKDLDEIIDKYDPQYVMLISSRNDGKSYAVKKRALRQAIDHGDEFSYLRRYEIDLKRADPCRYWADFEKEGNNVFEQLSGGLYDCITQRNREVFLLGKRAGKKIEEGKVVGHIHALSVAPSYKSLQFPNVRNILYEEFVSDRFLWDEPRKLMNYVSTILRSNVGQVWLVGNTITRINPYFREWQLTGFHKMKPGQIDVYDQPFTDDGGVVHNVRVCVHIPNVTAKSKGIKGMFFGTAAGMIAGQKWDSKEQPHLEKNVREYDTLYEMVFDFDYNATYYMRLLQDRNRPDHVMWYVEPKTTKLQPGTRLISPRFNESAGCLYTSRFTPISQRELRAFRLLDYGRIAYSDNLTGTEFQRALRMARTPETGE